MGIKFSADRPLTVDEEAEVQAMIASDPDAPEATDEQIAQATSFKEAFPDLHESIQRSRGRPTVAQPKQPITIRLSQDTIAKFKATGKGWQSRISDILDAAKLKI